MSLLVINLKTAHALGLTVPVIMQMTADEVIEELRPLLRRMSWLLAQSVSALSAYGCCGRTGDAR